MEGAHMICVKVYLADGNTITTEINMSLEEARRYYIGQYFNFGDTEECPRDRMVRVIDVVQLEGERHEPS